MSEHTSQPVACTLSRSNLAAQVDRWARLWGEAGVERAETEVGLRLVYLDAEAIEQELRALVAVESECCAWADWRVGREDGRLVMQVASSGAGIDTLHAMFTDYSARPSRTA